MKKIILTFIIFLFLCSSATGIFINDVKNPKKSHSSSAIYNESRFFSVTLKAAPYSFVTDSLGKTDIIMENYGSILVPGYPKLPSKTFRIGVPPGGEVVSIKLIDEKNEILPECYQIALASPIFNDINQVKYEINNEIFSLSDHYPSLVYEYLGMGQLRKYCFAQIRFSPIIYYPLSGKIKIFSEITLEIEYIIKKDISNELLTDNVMDDVASEIIDNYHQIYQSYYSSSTGYPLNNYNYVIVTTSSLENSIHSLKNWRENLGYNVKVVNISWISSNYDGWDLVEKIRNFLIDKYAEWGIEYVLIVGNYSTIPMRYCYPNKNNHNDDGKTSTDYYYADLTGDWDSDGDNFYGERDDDSPDFHAEIYVGRIPVNNPKIVEDICKKTMFYERENATWKNNILSCGPFICFENEDYTGWTRTDHATAMEELWNNVYAPNNYSRTTMYEKVGLDVSNYSCDYGLSKENVTSYWPEGYGIVNLDGHGNSQGIYRKWWEFDDGDGVPETGEIYWEVYLSSSDNISLNDDKPSIIFSIGCKTAFPEYDRNLGTSLLVNGSVAYIGATGTTWLRAGWENETSGGCQSIEYYFFEYLMNQNQTCAEALYNSKIFYWNYFDWGGWTVFQNLYDFCLYGDPALSLITYENHPPNTPIIDGPTVCKVGVSYNYTFNATDPDGDDIWYHICWGDKEIIYIYGPYQSGEEINLSYTWTDKGTYIIDCWATDIFDERSDTATLEVIIPRSKSFHFDLLNLFFNRFPNAFPILRYLLNL